ncbi:MAG: hypothetical protein ACLUYV_05265 [Alistipes shahii]
MHPEFGSILERDGGSGREFIDKPAPGRNDQSRALHGGRVVPARRGPHARGWDAASRVEMAVTAHQTGPRKWGWDEPYGET